MFSNLPTWVRNVRFAKRILGLSLILAGLIFLMWATSDGVGTDDWLGFDYAAMYLSRG